MRDKLAIIDYVGSKAGMNYYDNGLIKGLQSYKVQVFLFSNFISNHAFCISKKYFPKFIKNIFLKSFLLFVAYFRSLIFCRYKGVDTLIMHVFNTKFFYFPFFCLAKILGFNIVIISHDVFSLASDDNSLVKNWIYNSVASKIIVHNSYSYEKIKLFVSDLNKVHIIKQGSYLDILNPKITQKKAKKMLDLDENKKYILFFGQIKKKKRLDVLLNAMKFVDKDITLIVAGKAWKDDFFYYEKIIKKHKIENRVIQKRYFITSKERELIFKASDAMILPFEEVYQSASALMGMSYGLPVIASNISGFKEFIDNEINGLLFNKNSSLDLSEKINILFKDKKLYQKIKNNALLTMKNDFSWSKIALQYKNILNFKHE